MPQASTKLEEVSDEVIEHYSRLKNLLKSAQNSNAEKYFLDNSLLNIWRPLMHYAMVRRNCGVTSCMIDNVYSHASISKTAFRVEVSKLLHDITVDFSKKVIEYIDSGQYEVEAERISALGSLVKARLKSHTEKGIVDLKEHHFRRQYGQ